MSLIHVRFTFGSRAAKVKKSEKTLKSVPDLQIPDKSSTFAANFYVGAMKRFLLLALFAATMTAFMLAGLTSCNVTRTITTQSQYFTKGDTTCTIITKTIETYDASKK